jgi:hypothetical protein
MGTIILMPIILMGAYHCILSFRYSHTAVVTHKYYLKFFSLLWIFNLKTLTWILYGWTFYLKANLRVLEI